MDIILPHTNIQTGTDTYIKSKTDTEKCTDSVPGNGVRGICLAVNAFTARKQIFSVAVLAVLTCMASTIFLAAHRIKAVYTPTPNARAHRTPGSDVSASLKGIG